jgi:hypothetical protein
MMPKIVDNPLKDLTWYELERECNDCDNVDMCGKCPVLEEREFRMSERELVVMEREIDCDIRETNLGQDRDVYHNGSIIKGGGVCKPEWMDKDEYSEYKCGAEYAYECGHVSDSDYDEPDYDEDRW